ncbi:MAG: alpha/beta hydrolase [Flavobacteriales bacterium]
MRLLILLFLSFATSVVAQQKKAQRLDANACGRKHGLSVVGGQVYRFELPFGTNTRMIDVFIPKECEGKKGLKTLYMHDGQMLFDSTQTWNKQEWGVDELFLNKLGRYFHPQFIVVGIHNDPPNRYAEFFPQRVADYMPQSYRDKLLAAQWNGELKADAYLNWIEEILVPFIEQTYQTSHKTKDRMVLGSSMGGLISLYALCEKPKLFGAAACLSIHTPMINFGMFDEGMVEALVIPFNIYLEQELKADKKHRLYIDRGTETLDSYYGPYHERLLNTLALVGYDPMNPRFLEAVVTGAGHDERSWANRLEIPILFMLATDNSQ